MFVEHEHAVLRYTSVALAVVVSFMFTLAAALDGTWRAGGLSLSHLGISSNGTAAFIFNLGCVLSGMLFALVGLMKIRLEKKVDCIVGVFLILAAVFFVLIGFVNISVGEKQHVQVTVMFTVLTCIAVGLTLITDALKRRWRYVLPVIVTLIPVVCTWYNYSLCEVTAVLAGEVWLILQALRHCELYEGKPYSNFFALSDA